MTKTTDKQGHLFATFVILLLAGQVVAEANQVNYEVAPGMSKKQQKACKKVHLSLARLANDFAHVQQALDKGSKQLTVRCIDQERFSDTTDKAAFFDAGNKVLVHSMRAPKQLLSHECVHARAFFNGKECQVRDGIAGIPVNPVTNAQIKKLHKAFNKGDNRIKHYRELVLKKAKGLKLSKKETNLLKKYDEASKGVITSEEKLFVSQREHDLVKSKLKTSKTAVLDFPDFGSIFEFTQAGYDKAQRQFFILGKPRRGRAIVMMTPTLVKTYLQQHRLKGAHEYLISAEREAYSFQALPEKAQQVFYAEAYAMRKATIEKCEEQAKTANRTPRVEL